jgi:N-acetylmuramoyl-L-alanine amidase
MSPLDIVARTLYGEARGEVLLGIQAVASVIWNRWRLRPRMYGESINAVCLKPYQFSCWNENDPNRSLILKDKIDGEVYTRCEEVAKDYFAGNGKDVTEINATHYHAHYIDPPSWTKFSSAVKEIGNHSFYHVEE